MMSAVSFLTAARFESAPAKAIVRKGVRLVMMGIGFVLILVGLAAQLTPLPIHFPGLLVIVGGLVLVLRSSYSARRVFIRAQRRHPKVVFPMRRLLRREPEVAPVFWQQLLRTERLLIPRRWRVIGRTRRRLRRRSR